MDADTCKVEYIRLLHIFNRESNTPYVFRYFIICDDGTGMGTSLEEAVRHYLSSREYTKQNELEKAKQWSREVPKKDLLK